MTSLWGADFEIDNTAELAKKIKNKVGSPKSVVDDTKLVKSKKVPLQDKMAIIKSNVLKILGKFSDNTLVIRDKDTLTQYIDDAIKNGVISIDTETNNSLQPVDCKLMGACIYTPGRKQAYIPVNHINNDTGNLLENQLTESEIKEEFDRLSNTKIIMHNASFDYRVILCTCNCKLEAYWDTLLGARVLNENEKANLKQQYISKIDSTIEKYSIEKLFSGLPYEVFEPELFALYAATDAFMTYELYEYQKKQFELPENASLYKLFREIEMPVMFVAAQMELNGVSIDFEYAKKLSEKYNKDLRELEVEIETELRKYDDKIATWRNSPGAQARKIVNGKEQKSLSDKLENPVNLESPTQLAILFYDVLNLPVVDEKHPRSTGEETLTKLGLPICDLILEKRGLLKLINTYIDKLPNSVSSNTGKLHASFNQYGADTGRFSSSEPNLQNIPSHKKDIRMLFIPEPGNVFVGSDYSQQEPRLLASYAQDENMLGAYKDGKDLYATIASGVYKNNYEDNLEFRPDGTPNPEGKKRRGSCKSLLLGIMYGRGIASIAEQIGGTFEEAQKIIDDFYEGFPKVKMWMDTTMFDAKSTGYVEDLWGRRRRLPNLLLEPFEVTQASKSTDFNPILYCAGNKQDTELINKFKKELSTCKSKRELNFIKSEASKAGLTVLDNGGYIAKAERQCVNARVQGGAASMSKKAMILIHNDKEMNDLGFKLCLAVHDELIGECPKENAQKVADRLSFLMIQAAKPECDCPMKCDAAITSRWYEDDFSATIEAEFKGLLKLNNEDAAREKMLAKYPMINQEYLLEMMSGTYECAKYSDI